MENILTSLYNAYHTFNIEWSDPRSVNWFPVRYPILVLLLVFVYVRFVKFWGPKMMEKRRPFELKSIIMTYNALQILCNVYLFVQGVTYIFTEKYSWWCEPVDYSKSPHAMKMMYLTRMYYLLKISDLLDTIFYVLRKKQSQVSFLHVYHHGGMVIVTWVSAKYIPAGHGIFLAVMNTGVHSIMYTYYLMTSISTEYKKSLWWKKHLTQLQMIQFLINFVHLGLPLVWTECNFPKWALMLLCPQNLVMFTLFAKFYKKEYLNKHRKSD